MLQFEEELFDKPSRSKKMEKEIEKEKKVENRMSVIEDTLKELAEINGKLLRTFHVDHVTVPETKIDGGRVRGIVVRLNNDTGIPIGYSYQLRKLTEEDVHLVSEKVSMILSGNYETEKAFISTCGNVCLYPLSLVVKGLLNEAT